MNRFVEGASHAVFLPVEAGIQGARVAAKTGLLVIAGAVQVGEALRVRAFGPQAPLVTRLRREGPLHDARIGEADVLTGIARNDAERRDLGAGMVVTAMIRAEDSPGVPDSVVREVVAIADGLPIDPTQCPLVSEDIAQRAALIVQNVPLD